MWGTSSLESSEGGRETADGCSKWIFLVCNEATSPAAPRACGVFSGEDLDGAKNTRGTTRTSGANR